MSGPRAADRTSRRGRGAGAARVGGLAACLALLVALAGCDDQLKHVDTFAFMVDGPAIETYEQQPRSHPEGSVPVDGRRSYTLAEADTALSNPLESTTENIRQGRQAYTNFCLPCHGESGRGDGPVINNPGDNNPRRLPYIPTANLLSERARGYSDGYIYGMITNGRGFMPSYRRIEREKRWRLVLYVRHLQRTASDTAAAGGGTASSGATEQASVSDRE